MATRQHILIPLSGLARDPILRAFFDRSARDCGASFAIPPRTRGAYQAAQ